MVLVVDPEASVDIVGFLNKNEFPTTIIGYINKSKKETPRVKLL